MVKNFVVLGSQWGDEGKGKIIDFLSSQFDCIVRFQGGHNAGHTLVIDNKITKLSLIPSGILQNNTINLITNGVVISLSTLVNEITQILNQGINIDNRLQISESSPILLPIHSIIDKAREEYLGSDSIGTTRKGIGPVYEDKVARRSLRIGDLKYPEYCFRKLKILIDYHNTILKYYFKVPTVNFSIVLDYIKKYQSYILPFVKNTSLTLQKMQKQKKNILLEGAQGTSLDLDHGSYPYVTSSNTTIGASITGTGISPFSINKAIGVIKCYTTRVGRGPFPTEIKESKIKNHIIKRGNEFGTVTGRKRRCGWLDCVPIRHAILINGFHSLCITKLDILNGIKELKICFAYQTHKGEILQFPPSQIEDYKKCNPLYIKIKGWKENISGITQFSKLPVNVKKFLFIIERELDIKIEMISTGAERNEIINLMM